MILFFCEANARETVAVETFASSATSRRDTALELGHPVLFFGFVLKLIIGNIQVNPPQ